MLSANGAANLYLINPNGIIFGENASLNLGGSFFASTADSLLFEDNTEFSVVNPKAAPLLEVNIPIGANFRDNPGDIVNNSIVNGGNGLEVAAENNITLLGGNVRFDGGNIIAPGGRVELGSVIDSGTININNDGSLNFPDSLTRGDVSLINSARIITLSDGGGSIFVNAQNSELSARSFFASGISQNSQSTEVQAGDINVNVIGTFSLDTGSAILSLVQENGQGNGGSVEIQANSVFFSNSFINVLTSSTGNAGNISIKAEAVSLDGLSQVFSNVQGTGEGDAGIVDITATTLELTNGSQIASSTNGIGNAGVVNINSDTLSLDGMGINFDEEQLFSSIFSNVGQSGDAEGGEINISTKSLSVTNNAQLAAGTVGRGNAGNINIDANTVLFDNGNAFATIEEPNVEGDSGSIIIDTDSLSVTNGSQLNVGTFGIGNAGSLIVNAETVSFDGVSSDGTFPTQALAIVGDNAQGQGGNIDISADILSVTNGANINARTSGQGIGGNIKIDSSFLTLDNGSSITSFSQGQEAAGNIEISASEISLSDQSNINAEASSQDGGNINLLNSDLIILRRGSQITTEAGTEEAAGNGGNINIDSDLLIAFPDENNDIIANSFEGFGGAIDITTDGIFGLEIRDELTFQSDITSFSQTNPSLNGEISINTPEVDPTSGLIELPQAVGDATDQISQNPCQQGVGSEFIVTGKGGFPPSPTETLSSNKVKVGLVEPLSYEERGWGRGEDIVTEAVPAMGWVFNDRGEVTLTAYSTSGAETKRSPQQRSSSCSTP